LKRREAELLKCSHRGGRLCAVLEVADDFRQRPGKGKADLIFRLADYSGDLPRQPAAGVGGGHDNDVKNFTVQIDGRSTLDDIHEILSGQ